MRKNVVEFFIRVVALGLILLSFRPAMACSPFALYKGFKYQTSSQAAQFGADNEPVASLLNKISNFPGHSQFKSLLEKKRGKQPPWEKSHLSCLIHFLSLDTDNDGIPDWKIASDHQIFTKLIPYDEDWDGDGLDNFFDPQPLIFTNNKTVKANGEIPKHLWLSPDRQSQLNRMQKSIFQKCGVLALNHSDDHNHKHLKIFRDLCQVSMKNPSGEINLVLYAFASHAFTETRAAFYPEANYISIAGMLGSNDNQGKLKKVIAHEMGHFFIFNSMQPNDLLEVARKFTIFEEQKKKVETFFDQVLLAPIANGSEGYFPSDYAYTNLHEWFSEIYAEYLVQKVSPQKSSENLASLPEDLESWLTKRLHF